MSQANIDPSADLEQIIKDFNALVQKPNGSAPAGTSENNSLWYSWQFLQIYSTWGLRLPHTEATLKMKLGIPQPGQYLFFGPMVEGYNEIHQASYDFTTNIFRQVIGVGTSLLDFARNADPDDGGLFNVLIELIDSNDLTEALEFVSEIQNTAKENSTKATGVIELLNGYKAKLESAQGKVTEIKKLVEKDSKTSQATIDAIAGGAEVIGSIKALEKLLAGKKAEYDHAVVVAATTPTYAWAGPIGLVTAATIAGIYGRAAVLALRERDQLENKIKLTNKKLDTALETQKVSNSAAESVSQTQRYTDLAIGHTTTVQNAWNDLTNNLSELAAKVRTMTTQQDEQLLLKGKASVKAYAKIAGQKWALLVPPLKELTRKPYIVVEAGEKSLGEIANDVEKEITKLAA